MNESTIETIDARIDSTLSMPQGVNAVESLKDLEMVLLMDEASVQYSKDHELKKVKGIGLGLGVIENKKVKLKSWRGLVSYNNGVKRHWNKLFDIFVPVLLEEEIIGYEIYVCNFVYPFLGQALKRRIAGNNFKIRGSSTRETKEKIYYILDNLHQSQKRSRYYGKKEVVGDLTKKRIENIDERILKRVAETHLLYDIFLEKYIHS